VTTRRLGPTWVGMEGIFGGYVLAAAVDAAVLEGYRPLSVTLGFVSTVQPGEVDMQVEEVHRGRSTASLRIVMVQDGRLRAHCVVSMVRAGGEPCWEPQVDPTQWGTPEQSPVLVPNHRPLPYMDNLDLRRIGVDTMADGAAAWVCATTESGVELNPYARIALYLDVLPPGLFSLESRPTFIPSLEMTAHFSTRAALASAPEEWFAVRNKTMWSSKEYCVDECTLHNRAGTLVAQLRQGRAVRW